MANKNDKSKLKDILNDLKNDNETEIQNIDSTEVLIIDDNQWIHRILRHYLKEFGFKTSSSYDAYDGIAKALKSPPMLILLDIVMPDIKGDVLLKMFKKIEITEKIPVIIMSGNLNKNLLGDTYKSGAAGFISKPFTKKLVYDKIKSCLLGNGNIDFLDEEEFIIEEA